MPERRCPFEGEPGSFAGPRTPAETQTSSGRGIGHGEAGIASQPSAGIPVDRSEEAR